MRRIIIIMLLMLPMAVFAEKKPKVDSIQIVRDSILLAEIQLLEQIEIDLSWKNRYKMYQTENLYNLLQLDTKTGMVKQIQWALESENENIFTINTDDLSTDIRYGPGVFELYPTKNMYQFILQDKTNGRIWHVQWGLDDKHRWIRRIRRK